MKTVLVTGAAGFIGLNITKYFNDKKWCVIGIDMLKDDSLILSNFCNYL